MSERITEAKLDDMDGYPADPGVPERLVAEVRRLRALIVAQAAYDDCTSGIEAEARAIREEQGR